MVKIILCLLAACSAVSLLQMFMPLFGHNSKRWESQSYLQRFAGVFFSGFIALVAFFLVQEYRSLNSPSLNEKMLMNGETEYCLSTDLDEIGDADYVYEIKTGESQDKISKIISDICIDLDIGNGLAYTRYVNGEFNIIYNGGTIGKVVTYDGKKTTFLKFYLAD